MAVLLFIIFTSLSTTVIGGAVERYYDYNPPPAHTLTAALTPSGWTVREIE